MDLNNKVALVTGGGRGSGRGIVDVFLEEGAHVVIAQRSALDGELTADSRVAYVAADFSRDADFSAPIDRAVAAFGRLDVLVNCAGVMIEHAPDDMTLADWETTASVNLRAPLFLAQAALPQLVSGGSIINIGSIEGLSANPGHAAYAASKGGLHAMTRALAVDLGAHGVRCNAIAPGWIESDLSEQYIASMSDPARARDELHRLHPAGRLGHPRDIGQAAAFLASDRASFITGEILVVDGGRTAKLPTPT